MITIYKDFIRSHLYFGDILYDQAYNAIFHPKLEITQYNACLLAAVIYGTLKEELYQELGLERITRNDDFVKFSKTKHWVIYIV